MTFTCDPVGRVPLWFRLKVSAKEGKTIADESGHLRLVLEHYDTLSGAESPQECYPVQKAEGKFWVRMSSGKVERTEDGRVSASWLLNRSVDHFEVALSFPYEDVDLHQLINKMHGEWQLDAVGVSAGGRDVKRVSSSYGHERRYRGGIYIVARENGMDMPAAWVLDGLLQRVDVLKHNPYLIWAVPVADPDGARSGAGGIGADREDGWGGALSKQETTVIEKDLARWRNCCDGSLLLRIRAAALSEVGGIYCEVAEGAVGAEAVKWANVMQQKLGNQYTSAPFIREVARMPEVGVPALTVCVPWCVAGGVVLTQKKYREAGRLLADALLAKN